MANGFRQMCFSGSWRADKDESFSVADKDTGCQLADPSSVEIGCECEVKALQSLLETETGAGNEPLDLACLSGVDFILQKKREKAFVIELVFL
jgi:hypothetical protein